MEGSIAKLPDILQLAREYNAIVIVDDSHATGVLGAMGRGTAEYHGVLGEVDVITLHPFGESAWRSRRWLRGMDQKRCAIC